MSLSLDDTELSNDWYSYEFDGFKGVEKGMVVLTSMMITG